jgi:hypothetical protein
LRKAPPSRRISKVQKYSDKGCVKAREKCRERVANLRVEFLENGGGVKKHTRQIVKRCGNPVRITVF